MIAIAPQEAPQPPPPAPGTNAYFARSLLEKPGASVVVLPLAVPIRNFHWFGSGVTDVVPRLIHLLLLQLLEFIRDGRSVAELMDVGRQLLGRRQVQPGVSDLVHEVQVEGTFPDGTKLVTVHDPVCAVDGDLDSRFEGLRRSLPPIPQFHAPDAITVRPNDPPPYRPQHVLLTTGTPFLPSID